MLTFRDKSNEGEDSSLPAEDYVPLAADVATFDGIPYIDNDANDAELNEMLKYPDAEADLPPPPAWTRCSPADLYFKREPTVIIIIIHQAEKMFCFLFTSDNHGNIIFLSGNHGNTCYRVVTMVMYVSEW
jgi:hypothetical protein